MITSKKTLFITLLFCLGAAFFRPLQAQDLVDRVEKMINQGAADALVELFSDPVDLKIGDKEGVFSADHTRMALKNFFRENPPKSFEINHKGSSNDGSFAIGTYKCNDGGSYQIYFLMRSEAKSPEVMQFFVEED
ncbi:MAG: DUF4783 domain-containing protein [Bacteroidota bacterium]